MSPPRDEPPRRTAGQRRAITIGGWSLFGALAGAYVVELWREFRIQAGIPGGEGGPRR